MNNKPIKVAKVKNISFALFRQETGKGTIVNRIQLKKFYRNHGEKFYRDMNIVMDIREFQRLEMALAEMKEHLKAVI